MGSSPQDGVAYWGYLIQQDKTAAPKFDQLCRGLARIIRSLEPGPENRITPSQIARFYREVNGNYDTLFLKTSDSGVSQMYQTLGCYHSLEPTRNPFELPCKPCLTDDGFVKWSTLQMLLCPKEQVGFMQRAVHRWNVPKPDGGSFPNHIPSECFPDQPDREMEKWHKFVTSQMNQSDNIRRLKYSPHSSPYVDSRSNSAGYFGPVPAINRPTNSDRRKSQDEGSAKLLADRRRSSVPDLPSPNPPGVHLNDVPINSSVHRSVSGRRNGNGSRPRSSTANSYRSPTSLRSSQSMGSNRQASNTSLDRSSRPKSSRERPRSSGESAEDASSEDSTSGRRSRSKEGDGLRNKLWPPFFLSSNKRRHSTGPEYRDRDDTSPRREASRRESKQYLDPNRPYPSTVRFRDDVFHNGRSSQTFDSSSSPEGGAASTPPTSYRYTVSNGSSSGDPQTMQPYSPPNRGLPDSAPYQPISDLDLDQTQNQFSRSNGMPLRVSTVSGVKGRKYALPEPPKSAGASSRDGRDRGEGRHRHTVASIV